MLVFSEQIARLREEGSRQLEEEQRLIREQIQKERDALNQQFGEFSQRSMFTCKKSRGTDLFIYFCAAPQLI